MRQRQISYRWKVSIALDNYGKLDQLPYHTCEIELYFFSESGRTKESQQQSNGCDWKAG